MDRLDSDFARDPRACGWTLQDPKSENTLAPWQHGTDGPACISANGGCWESPPLEVTPHEYYRIEFRCRADGGGYWGAVFCDEDGNQLESDHYSGMDRAVEWTDREFCFRARAGAASARICVRTPVGKAWAMSELRVAPTTRAAVGEWADAVARTIPPLQYVPDPGRGRCLQRVLARLRAREHTRVVMLGDSIMNDIGNSPWDVLVERHYDGPRIDAMTSVRGSTGCRFYQEDAHLRRYVLDYAPQLLIIGGISNGADIDAVRNVIRAVRRASDADIMLMFNARVRIEEPGEVNPPTLDLEPQMVCFRDGLAALAGEEGAEFYDIHAVFTDYLRRSIRPFAYYARDALHINARGRQVFARILEHYFAPVD